MTLNATKLASAPEPAAPPRQRRKEARPGELIDAAIEVFGEKGFAAARLDDVARRAGTSKGTPYLYFANKEELFKAAIREAVVTRLELGEQYSSAFDGSAEDLLRLIVDGWWEFERSRYGGILKLVIAEALNFPDLARFYLDEVVLRGRRFIAAVIRRGIDRGEFRPMDAMAAAIVIFAPLSFFSVWQRSLGRFEERPITPETFIATYLDVILAGLKMPPAPAGKEPDHG